MVCQQTLVQTDLASKHCRRRMFRSRQWGCVQRRAEVAAGRRGRCERRVASGQCSGSLSAKGRNAASPLAQCAGRRRLSQAMYRTCAAIRERRACGRIRLVSEFRRHSGHGLVRILTSSRGTMKMGVSDGSCNGSGSAATALRLDRSKLGGDMRRIGTRRRRKRRPSRRRVLCAGRE
jgi:hypothetical protein